MLKSGIDKGMLTTEYETIYPIEYYNRVLNY